MRLSGLVVLTTMVGYAMSPGALQLSTLLWTTVGTALCVNAANTFNQWAEVPFDAQMKRTRVRPLVRGALTPWHVATVASLSAVSGVAMLATQVNPLVAALGASNIVLYAFIYTPLKRTSIINTWVGAVVGALPPMMGWAASTGSLETGAWLLGGVLYAWQFPHFNALSWNLRGDYSRAGYRMMSVTDPGLCCRTSLRYSAAMIPLTLMASYTGTGYLAFLLSLICWLAKMKNFSALPLSFGIVFLNPTLYPHHFFNLMHPCRYRCFFPVLLLSSSSFLLFVFLFF